MVFLGALAGCVSPPRPPAAPPTAAQCLGQLAAQGVRFETVAVPVATNGCGIDTAVRVEVRTTLEGTAVSIDTPR